MIRLTNKLVLTADDHQYIVGRPRQRADRDGSGAITIDNPRYFTTPAAAVESVLSAALRDRVASGDIRTLREFLSEYARLRDVFAKQIEPLDV